MTTLSCPRAGRWFRGCRWEARYDTVRPSAFMSAGLNASGTAAELLVASLVHRSTYVRDVCRTCGAARERATHHHSHSAQAGGGCEGDPVPGDVPLARGG